MIVSRTVKHRVHRHCHSQKRTEEYRHKHSQNKTKPKVQTKDINMGKKQSDAKQTSMKIDDDGGKENK
jgi:hypothetical protein